MENFMSETVESQPAPQASTADTAPAGLTLADLILSAQIVQRGASAGIFKADELKSIGDYYDRLIKFLESSGAISRTPVNQEQPAPAPTGE
jgi:hypothetical protein